MVKDDIILKGGSRPEKWQYRKHPDLLVD